MSEPTDFSGIVGDRVVIEPDRVLQKGIGEFSKVVVVGVDRHGVLYVASSHGADTITLLESAKIKLIIDGFAED